MSNKNKFDIQEIKNAFSLMRPENALIFFNNLFFSYSDSKINIILRKIIPNLSQEKYENWLNEEEILSKLESIDLKNALFEKITLQKITSNKLLYALKQTYLLLNSNNKTESALLGIENILDALSKSIAPEENIVEKIFYSNIEEVKNITIIKELFQYLYERDPDSIKKKYYSLSSSNQKNNFREVIAWSKRLLHMGESSEIIINNLEVAVANNNLNISQEKIKEIKNFIEKISTSIKNFHIDNYPFIKEHVFNYKSGISDEPIKLGTYGIVKFQATKLQYYIHFKSKIQKAINNNLDLLNLDSMEFTITAKNIVTFKMSTMANNPDKIFKNITNLIQELCSKANTDYTDDDFNKLLHKIVLDESIKNISVGNISSKKKL